LSVSPFFPFPFPKLSRDFTFEGEPKPFAF
jgi:hypothetical protein